MNALKIFAIGTMLLTMTACQDLTTLASAISDPDDASAVEKELCQNWGTSLPTRSRNDTAETRAQIQTAYAKFVANCPNFQLLVP